MNRELLRERFGRTIIRDLEHCATPLRRSVMAELEQAFADDFARTAASRFRSATDISVTNSLYHYYALMTGRAVTTTRPRVRYVQTTLAESLRRMERLANRTDVDMFCLNDGGAAQIPEEVRVRALRDDARADVPGAGAVGARRGQRSTPIGSVGASVGAALSGGDPRRGEAPLRLGRVDELERAGRVDRHDRVHDRVVVDVDEVERLRAVLRAGAADGHGEVLRVAGR